MAAPPERSDEVADQQVREHRVAARDHVVAALDDHERRARSARRAAASARRLAVVVGAVDEQHRAADGRQTASIGARSSANAAPLSASIASMDPSQRPADRVVDRLGRVRLGRDLVEEEAGEARVVPPPVVAVELRPALVGRQLVVERVLDASGAAATSRGTPTANATSPGRAPVARGERTARQTPSTHSPTSTARSRPGRVHDAAMSATSRSSW